ncbi:MAG: CDP-alcohol phosphatidyltransferase family protein, partial [Gammaproteobacteria bacterium]
DHTDGEFARLGNTGSRFGHYFDLAADALVTIGMFVGIGVGLAADNDHRNVVMGAIAGVAVALIFQLRYLIEERHGKLATRQPRLGGFEAEDVLYLLPLVTLTGSLSGFLVAAAIGAPLAAIIVAVQYVRIMRVADA